MYGKIFASLYEGSMVGAGPVVFAVWGYCIAKADTDGTVLINPSLLAVIIGTSKLNIDTAIEYLASPDEHSKNQDHEGRRLLHRSGHLYFVVSHHIYRGMKNNEERRKYMREYMTNRRKSDTEEPVNSLQSLQELTKVNPASASVFTSASLSPSQGECEGGDPISHKSTYSAEFEQFWAAYPKRRGKGAAFKAWRVARKKADIDYMLAAISEQSTWDEWTRDNGQYIPNPATWLNQSRWEDEGAQAATKPKWMAEAGL